MNKINTVNLGLDTIAKAYLKRNLDPEKKPIIYDRKGPTKSIKLHRYKMKDGSTSEEYIQFLHMNEHENQTVYFIGLKTNKRYMEWPTEKVSKKLKLK
jgi:hypothetical protein